MVSFNFDMGDIVVSKCLTQILCIVPQQENPKFPTVCPLFMALQILSAQQLHFPGFNQLEVRKDADVEFMFSYLTCLVFSRYTFSMFLPSVESLPGTSRSPIPYSAQPWLCLQLYCGWSSEQESHCLSNALVEHDDSHGQYRSLQKALQSAFFSFTLTMVTGMFPKVIQHHQIIGRGLIQKIWEGEEGSNTVFERGEQRKAYLEDPIYYQLRLIRLYLSLHRRY